MDSIKLNAGKMELVQAIADISNPEVLAKARKALYRILYPSLETEEEEDLMLGGVPAVRFTKEELNAHIDQSLQDIMEGHVYTSAEVHRMMEEKFPFLCE